MIVKAAAALTAALFFASAAHAQEGMRSSPDFFESAGEWDIEGSALGKGNTIICKMQKETADGSPFADIFMMSAGFDGFTVIDAYVTKTAFPEGSAPKVAIYFDGKKTAELTGGVEKGYLQVVITSNVTPSQPGAADIAKLAPLDMGRITGLLKSSESLMEIASLEGHPSERITVDLA